MPRKGFVWRWREGADGQPVEVMVSLRNTKEECWEWSVQNLRPALVEIEEAKDYMKQHGEVVEVTLS